MSFFDEMADLAGELMTGDFKSPARLYRTVKDYDKATGKTAQHKEEVACFAVVGPRWTKAENGVLTVQTVATVYGATPKIDDKLVVGNLEHTVAAVETIAPNGTAIMWKAVLK